MNGRVVVVGSANVDLVLDAPRMPHPGETVLAGALHRHPGGKGANQAVGAAVAGGADTTFLGVLGSDESAALLLESLRRAGVRTDLVDRSDAATGTAVIVVSPEGENAIVVAPGANGDLRVGAPHFERIGAADVVLTQLETPLEVVRAAASARAPGAWMVLNAAPCRELPDDVLTALDLLVVNEHEAVELAGTTGVESATVALLDRVPAVVVTLGGRGAVVAERGRDTVRLQAARVEVVDTTGAGDVFCGALAAALARGEALSDAARLACAAGTLAVTRPGAQTAVPTAAEVAGLACRTENHVVTGGGRS